jgi:tetratricopeptide (TPR) repeat protein
MNINKAIQSAFENYKKGNLREAESLYRKILNKQPNNPDILHMLGLILCQFANYDLAIPYIRKALQFRPANVAGVYCNLGIALQGKGLLDEAITSYQKAIELNPAFAEAYGNLGIALKEKGQFDEAITHYQKAIKLNPASAKAYYNLGVAFWKKERPEEAITQFLKAIELKPSFAEAYCNLGAALMEKEQLGEAITHFLKAIELNPAFPKAYCNLGIALQGKGLLDEAITHYQKAIDLNPSFAEAYCNLGNALKEKGQIDEAICCYKRAIELNPDYETPNFNMSLTLLLTGNFKEGWRKYEWRWKERDFLKRSGAHHTRSFSQPFWDGSSIKEKSLLIYAEQGVGDEIMFASCFQDLINQARVCTVECDKRLIPIFSRSFPEAVFIERIKKTDAFLSQLPQTDMVIPLGSLPKFLRPDFDAFPQTSYLIPDAEKVQAWRNRIKTLGDGLAVGISWRGGALPSVKRNRSIMLEQWAELFSLSGLHFINLQYGDCRNELKEAKKKLNVTIHDWEDANPLIDLDNFAAQIAALDLIISVDNSTVHMAGALGKPVWLLLPYAPDWRWMLNREDSPWYPTMRLFRQPSPGDWESVIAKVKDELLKLLGSH